MEGIVRREVKKFKIKRRVLKDKKLKHRARRLKNKMKFLRTAK